MLVTVDHSEMTTAITAMLHTQLERLYATYTSSTAKTNAEVSACARDIAQAICMLDTAGHEQWHAANGLPAPDRPSRYQTAMAGKPVEIVEVKAGEDRGELAEAAERVSLRGRDGKVWP